MCLVLLITTQAYVANAQVDFRKETIYFLLTTRFFDGDPSNNRPNEWCSYGPNSPSITDPKDVTWRGDFKGLIQKLDYIQDLGFTAIWITPIVQNRGPLDYHGYHAWDFTKVDPRLESPGATFQDLINAVHARGMKIVLDVVTNHSGRFGIKGKAELKYNTDPNQPWGKNSAGGVLQDNPNWEYDGLTPNPDDGKIWSRANLAKMPAPYNSNLVAYNWPSTESFLSTSDPNWFHHSGNGFAQGWDDTENLYNRALAGDCPDLNTGSQAVRDYLVAAYTKFIKMGVDGFRWDTMKHMEKAEALYFLEKFKAANPNLFVFAEVAQKRHELHNVEQINPHWYTWKGGVGSSANSGLAVIDFYAEATFHNVFEEGQAMSNVKAAARYDHLYSDPSTLVTWLDNHDFGPNNDWNRRYGGTPQNLAACMNFMFTWRGIPSVYYGTEMQFMKGAYTDIHDAAGISQSLNLTGRAYYGDAMANASGHKIYQHIKKLNAIRKAVPALQNGTWTWAGGDGNNNGVGYIRKSGSSEVAVGIAKDAEVTFNFMGLTNGTYRDAVTGRSASVTNGSLSFSVKPSSAGIYVLNGPGIIGGSGVGFFQPSEETEVVPIVTIDKPSGSYPSAFQVALSATGQATPIKIYYTTNGTTPNASSTLYTGAIPINANTNLRAIAIDSQNRKSSVAIADYTIGEVSGFTVYFKKPANWGSTVSVYYWNTSPTSPSVTWPGQPMVYDAGNQWWSFRFSNITSSNLTFNDGMNETPALSRNKTGWYKDGVWYDSNPETTGDNPPVIIVTPAGPHAFTNSVNVTLSATDDSGITPTLYFTVDGSEPSLSSPSATGSKNLILTSSTIVKVFAADNTGLKSATYTHNYTLSAATGITIYFKKPSSWTTPVKIHYWNAQPSGSLAATNWPGANMTLDATGNDWYVYSFPPNVVGVNMVINSNGSTTSKTSDLIRNKTGWYDNGIWYDTDPRTTANGLKIHLKTRWANPKIYYWNATPGAATTTWPGESMTPEGNGWYVFTIPNANCSNLIFSNNGVSQTGDLHRCGEGSYNNGIWSNTVIARNPAVDVRVATYEGPDFELQHYPNPTSGHATIMFNLENESHVNLKIYNDQGSEVMELVNGKLSSGPHRIEMNMSSLKPGLYLYKISTGRSFKVSKMMVAE